MSPDCHSWLNMWMMVFNFSIVVMVCVVSALSAGVTLVELQFLFQLYQLGSHWLSRLL